MIHYLFLGFFDHEGTQVRLAKRQVDGAFHPVVCRSLDAATVQSVLQEGRGSDADARGFPEGWTSWLDGYVVCDKHTTNEDEMNFIAQLVARTSCDIYDVSAMREISLEEWLNKTPGYAKP